MVVCLLAFLVSNSWPMLSLAVAAALMVRSIVLVPPVLVLVLVLVLNFDLSSQDVGGTTSVIIFMGNFLAAFVIYILTRLSVALDELFQARELLALARVEEERHRISRTLHDVIGRTFVAVSLRNQTAMRLLDTDVEACRVQLDAIDTTIRDGQSELRKLVAGPAVYGLENELLVAHELLANFDVDLQIERRSEPSQHVDLLGAKVLREAITNLLKHSKPTQVVVSLDEHHGHRVLRITNDGVTSPRATEGTGLSDLAAQAEALGETLTAQRLDDRFEVTLRIREVEETP